MAEKEEKGGGGDVMQEGKLPGTVLYVYFVNTYILNIETLVKLTLILTLEIPK